MLCKHRRTIISQIIKINKAISGALWPAVRIICTKWQEAPRERAHAANTVVGIYIYMQLSNKCDDDRSANILYIPPTTITKIVLYLCCIKNMFLAKV